MTRVVCDSLGEILSLFPLTVVIQRIALQAAETLGVSLDTFDLDVSDRAVWKRVEL